MQTGLAVEERDGKLALKYNPYHDPDNGRFTFAPGGPMSLPGAVTVPQKPKPGLPQARPDTAPTAANPLLIPAQYRPPLRGGIGRNSGAFRDPMTQQPVIPPVQNVPGGTIIALADGLFDVTGPGQRVTEDLTAAFTKKIVAEIQSVDPSYRLRTLGMPTTPGGQERLMTSLLQDRAAAYYRMRGETHFLKVEVTRLLQRRATNAYDIAVNAAKRGELSNLSPELAIGRFVDRGVRQELRRFYATQRIDITKGGIVRVNSREYDRSGTDATYRIPDARIDRVAFDVTLTRKTLSTPQVRGFFAADLKPQLVVIIRPQQLGPNSSYAITAPKD
jgi:hypothetical protein